MQMNKRGEFGGSLWSNITTQDWFHGVLLKMSVDEREIAGYKCRFTDPLSVNLSMQNAVILTDYLAWALKVMIFCRFKQI